MRKKYVPFPLCGAHPLFPDTWLTRSRPPLQVYQTTLANVDYLHGSAEFMLTLTNLFVVIGLKGAIDDAKKKKLAETDEANALGSSTRES